MAIRWVARAPWRKSQLSRPTEFCMVQGLAPMDRQRRKRWQKSECEKHDFHVDAFSAGTQSHRCVVLPVVTDDEKIVPQCRWLTGTTPIRQRFIVNLHSMIFSTVSCVHKCTAVVQSQMSAVAAVQIILEQSWTVGSHAQSGRTA